MSPKKVAKKKTTAKAPKNRQIIKKKYDIENAKLILEYPDGEIKEFDFQGMQFDHLGWLAMHGAAAILSKRRHPESAWDDMRNGIFHRRKSKNSYPLVVQAYANWKGMDIADAQKAWNETPKDARSKIRRSASMKYHVLLLQAEQAKADLESDASA